MPSVTTPAPPAKTELAARWQLDVGDYAVDVDISHDGSMGAVGTGSGDVIVVDIETGTELWRSRAHAGGVTRVAFSPREPILATAGQDGRARLFHREGTPRAEL